MKVIVASHDLWPTPALASRVLAIMLSGDGVFAVRTSGYRPASMIEDMALRIGSRIGVDVHSWVPPVSGSRAGYVRDVSMVEHSDHVYAFFAPDRTMDGGTGHVVACALRAGIAVDAYELDSAGEVVEIGSDPGNLLPLYTGD